MNFQASFQIEIVRTSTKLTRKQFQTLTIQKFTSIFFVKKLFLSVALYDIKYKLLFCCFTDDGAAKAPKSMGC